MIFFAAVAVVVEDSFATVMPRWWQGRGFQLVAEAVTRTDTGRPASRLRTT